MPSKENKVEREESVETLDDMVEIQRPVEQAAGETPEETVETPEESVEEADTGEPDGQGEPETDGEEPGEETDEARIKRLEKELAESNDKYVRLAAEFENFKRRNSQEMQSRFKFANQGLVSNLLSGMDSLERAIEQAREEENEALKEFVTGIEMAIAQFYDAFAKHNIERIVPTGELFDPNKHEAMGVLETDEVEPDHVAMVFQAGYMLHDRVIRPAMVQVAKKNK